MPRVVLILAYDGTNYHGWQIQKSKALSTVERSLKIAISQVADHEINLVVAGRTDAKVHASYQVVHFDTLSNRNINAWVYGVNRFLPADIRVLSGKFINPEFDARRSAIKRTYDYLIYNSQIRPSLFKNYLTWEYKYLDVELMQQASSYWLGEHDFTSFRGKDCQSNSSYRRVDLIRCYRRDNFIKISITANAFLKHMVRNMIGTLIKLVTTSKKSLLAKEILLARDRALAGFTAPPQGLYLSNVEYPKYFNLNGASKIDDFNFFNRVFS